MEKKKRSEKRKRPISFHVRMTPEEHAKFLQRCERSGLSTGDYFRGACLEQPPLRAVRQVSVDRKLLSETNHQLIRYGNNLNQVAHKLNKGSYIDHRIRESVLDALENIKELSLKIRQSLGYDTQRINNQ